MLILSSMPLRLFSLSLIVFPPRLHLEFPAPPPPSHALLPSKVNNLAPFRADPFLLRGHRGHPPSHPLDHCHNEDISAREVSGPALNWADSSSESGRRRSRAVRGTQACIARDPKRAFASSFLENPFVPRLLLEWLGFTNFGKPVQVEYIYRLLSVCIMRASLFCANENYVSAILPRSLLAGIPLSPACRM